MPQFFIDKEFEQGEEVLISGKDAHHITDVLRLRDGDSLVLSDGQARSFRARIVSTSKAKVRAMVEAELPRRKSSVEIDLAIAVIKQDRFELAIQKCVELGCSRIFPFTTARTSPARMVKDKARALLRWRRIALEAAKQSGLAKVPSIEEIVPFDHLIRTSSSYDVSALFYEGEDKTSISDLWRSGLKGNRHMLIIGPEGGFTRDEVDAAREAEVEILGLGTQILRAETAAIAALAIWQKESGNME
jgi:16S rRNA (uracil1498-N3)-methyltransferase